MTNYNLLNDVESAQRIVKLRKQGYDVLVIDTPDGKIIYKRLAN